MLTKQDYKILFELDDNARQSLAQIASKVGTSKQVVSNHLNKLVKEDYIKFLTILDLSKIDLILHKVYLRLIRTSEKDEEQIANYLNKHKNVSWLAKTEGIYDIAAAYFTKDINELNEVLSDLENKFGKFISEKAVNRIITGEFFHRDYLVENKQSPPRKNIIFQTQEQAHKLDETDWVILSALCQNSRQNIIKISEKVKLSADAVGKRIKNLEKKGIIKNYIIVLNTEKLEKLHYKVLLKINNFTKQTEQEFIEFCRQHPNITFYNKSIGSWEIEIDLEVEKSEQFRKIMRSLKNNFADFIKEYFSLIIYDVMKFNFLPMYEQ